ncbi:MAG: calcium-binding protein [Alphaproteobacteria bacterium]
MQGQTGGIFSQGTDQDDTITGSAGADVLRGGYGNDRLEGADGNDVLDGERGSDLLIGGAGNDVLIAASDGGEPVVAQNYNPNQGRNGEIDPTTNTLYPNQPFIADDMLVGGAGADLFLIKPQINAKADIIAKHTDDDGRIDWADVAGENGNIHDHWVDRIATDTIVDFSRAEGDQIFVYGHTAAISVTHDDVDGDGDQESIIEVISDQPNGGAHDNDKLGYVIVNGDRITEDDVEVNRPPTYGVVETIGEILEAVNPSGVTDPTPESTQTDNPFVNQVTKAPAGVEPVFTENVQPVVKVAGEDETVSGTGRADSLIEDAGVEAAASLGKPISFWSLSDGENGVFADAGGVANAFYYIQDNGEASLQTGFIPVMPGPDGQLAPLFGVQEDSFAYVAHNEAYEVLNGTVTAWFNSVDLGGTQTIFAKDGSGPQGGGHFKAVVNSDGTLEIRFAEGDNRGSSGYNHEWETKEPVVEEGVWHHVALSFTETGLAVYLDGERLDDNAFKQIGGSQNVALSDYQKAYIIGNDKPMLIGAGSSRVQLDDTAEALGIDDRLDDFFEGGITQVGFWGGDTPAAALTDAQIQELVQNGPGDLSEAGPGLGTVYTVSDEIINGNGGNDTLDGGAGDDSLNGGDGNDVLMGGYGDDAVNGESGNDTVQGGHGNDTVMGGDGNDLVLSRSDGREPLIAQSINRDDDPDYDIDFDARLLYPSQAAMPSNDVLTGGAGADDFRIETLINAKEDIINRHVNDDRTINWQGVAGENTDVHDHWVDRIGDDTITDLNLAEGDSLTIAGHTTEVFDIEYALTDGNDRLDTVLHLRSNQGNSGAHNKDLLGTLTVLDVELDEDDFTVDRAPFYGIVDTIDQYKEAITPLILPDETIPTEPGAPLPDEETPDRPDPDPSDTPSGTRRNDVLTGTEEGETLNALAGNDTVSGQGGDDTLLGANGRDSLEGGSGNDDLQGGNGRDTLEGGGDNDTLDGGIGVDQLNGGDGDDSLDGAGGSDTLEGGDGNDTLLGDRGSDAMAGGGGEDALTGGAGRDTLDGGTGDDTLEGGRGGDRLIGGDGVDTFVLADRFGRDVLVDFSDGDLIDAQGTTAGFADFDLNGDGLIDADDVGRTVRLVENDLILRFDGGARLTIEDTEALQSEDILF